MPSLKLAKASVWSEDWSAKLTADWREDVPWTFHHTRSFSKVNPIELGLSFLMNPLDIPVEHPADTFKDTAAKQVRVLSVLLSLWILVGALFLAQMRVL